MLSASIQKEMGPDLFIRGMVINTKGEHNMKKFFRGIMVPVMTPFTAKGEIDKDAFVKHVSFLIESGVNSLLVPSGTGEFANLTWEEKSMLTRLAAETSAGRIPVVALVSDCSTRNVISLANIAKDAGADEIMLTPPYYSYVDQRALLEMYTTVADTCNLPLWIYHQPGETKIVIDIDTVLELSKHPNIVGIKVAAGENFMYFAELTRALRGNEEFSILMGEDFATLPSYVMGGDGSVSSLANVVPKAFVDIFRAYEKKDIDTAEALQRDIMDYFESFVMVSTGCYQSACKTILREMGIYKTNRCSRPFVEILPEEENNVIAAAKALSII